MKLPHRKIILIVGFAAVAFASISSSIPQGEESPNTEAKALLEMVYSNPASVSATENLRIGLQARAAALQEKGITEKAVVSNIVLTRTEGRFQPYNATGTYQIRGGKTPIDLPIHWEFTLRNKARGGPVLTELSEEPPQ